MRNCRIFKMGAYPLLLFTITNSSIAAPKKSDLPKPSKTQCQFYLDLEKILTCRSNSDDSSDYLTEYGYPYCSDFLRLQRKSGGKFRDWMVNVRLCLQKQLIVDPELLSPCSKMEMTGFNSHAPCYTEYGYCDLEKKDRLQVSRQMRVYDLARKGTKSLAQMTNVALICGIFSEIPEHLFAILFEITRDASDAVRKEASNMFQDIPLDREGSEKYASAGLAALLGIQGEKTPKQMESDIRALSSGSQPVETFSFEWIAERCKQPQSEKNSICDPVVSKSRMELLHSSSRGARDKLIMGVISKAHAVSKEALKQKA